MCRRSLPTWTSVDIRNRETIRKSLDVAVEAFGGVDILINTAALFPSSPDGVISDAMWATTLDVNVTANYLLADEAAKLFKDQDLEVSVVLTSSANAVVSKRGSEAVRREQGGAEPPGARAGDWAFAEGACEWDQPGDCGKGLDDVSAGPGAGFAGEVQHCV